MVVGAGATRVEVVAVLTLVALLGLEHFEGPGTAKAKCFFAFAVLQLSDMCGLRNRNRIRRRCNGRGCHLGIAEHLH